MDRYAERATEASAIQFPHDHYPDVPVIQIMHADSFRSARSCNKVKTRAKQQQLLYSTSICSGRELELNIPASPGLVGSMLSAHARWCK